MSLRAKWFPTGDVFELHADCWLLGRLSRKENIGIDANPYPPGSDKFKSWRYAWQDADAFINAQSEDNSDV